MGRLDLIVSIRQPSSHSRARHSTGYSRDDGPSLYEELNSSHRIRACSGHLSREAHGSSFSGFTASKDENRKLRNIDRLQHADRQQYLGPKYRSNVMQTAPHSSLRMDPLTPTENPSRRIGAKGQPRWRGRSAYGRTEVYVTGSERVKTRVRVW